MKQTKNLRHIYGASAIAMTIGLLPLGAALADDAKAPAKWSDTIKLGAQFDVGFTWNPSDPNDGRNFGRLYDDQSNTPTLNSLLLTATRPIDNTKPEYDFGFKLQGMYGSDARYTHFVHELDSTTRKTLQFDIVEANLLVHTPWLSDGGIDWKLGQYPTPVGNEVIDPSGNTFYSHSYIYNFGIPVKHTGGYATWHATGMFDLYAGVDAGNQTSFGTKGDNNGTLAGLAGVGVNLMDGNLTFLYLNHFGPENPRGALDLNGNPIDVNGEYRFYNDLVTVWKFSDKITLTNEAAWVHDNGVDANGYGMAQYVSYALSDLITLSARAEVFRDDKGFFVAQFGNNVDFARLLRGQAAQSARTVSGGKTTYGALTVGAQIKPTIPYVSGLTIRPEIRYDDALSSNIHPFNDSKDRHMFTAGIDAIIAF